MNTIKTDNIVLRYRVSLELLLEQVPHLSCAMLAKTDGFEVTSVTRGTVPISRLAALCSSLTALGNAALQEMGFKKGGSILIEGETGKLLLLEVPRQGAPMVLALVGDGNVVTGSLLWAARDCVRQLIDS